MKYIKSWKSAATAAAIVTFVIVPSCWWSLREYRVYKEFEENKQVSIQIARDALLTLHRAENLARAERVKDIDRNGIPEYLTLDELHQPEFHGPPILTLFAEKPVLADFYFRAVSIPTEDEYAIEAFSEKYDVRMRIDQTGNISVE